MNTMPFGKFKGTPLSQVPIWYLWWLNGKYLQDPLKNALGDELERRENTKRRRTAKAAA